MRENYLFLSFGFLVISVNDYKLDFLHFSKKGFSFYLYFASSPYALRKFNITDSLFQLPPGISPGFLVNVKDEEGTMKMEMWLAGSLTVLRDSSTWSVAGC